MIETAYDTLLQTLGLPMEASRIVADKILELERELNAARARIAELEHELAAMNKEGQS